MIAIVALETVALALLGVLVAGLLRSHAEILRALHRLGVDLDPDGPGRAQAAEIPSGRALLLFLTRTCAGCAPLWEGLAGHGVTDTQVVVVTRDAAEEGADPPDGGVASSAMWEAWKVPGSPYAVLIEDGAVIGRGVAHSWEQLRSFVARGDVDRQLLAAGITPGHPSLYPKPE